MLYFARNMAYNSNQFVTSTGLQRENSKFPWKPNNTQGLQLVGSGNVGAQNVFLLRALTKIMTLAKWSPRPQFFYLGALEP